MKTRSANVPQPRQPSPETEAGATTKSKNGTAAEFAEIRVALVRAREQIGLEVERRQRVEEEFSRHVTVERELTRKKLHDGLGQVLTSISFLATSLRTKLREQGINDPAELNEIAALINKAIAESRSLAATCDSKPTRSFGDNG